MDLIDTPIVVLFLPNRVDRAPACTVLHKPASNSQRLIRSCHAHRESCIVGRAKCPYHIANDLAEPVRVVPHGKNGEEILPPFNPASWTRSQSTKLHIGSHIANPTKSPSVRIAHLDSIFQCVI